MYKIFTGADKAKEFGIGTYRDFAIELAKNANKPWNGEWSGSKVYARVDFGRWIADCECGGASYVDPDDDFFYCATCGNAAHNGKARHVIFPDVDERQAIEEELLKRDVKTRLGLTGTDAALNATGFLSRSWKPGESVETLKEQRERMDAERRKHGV